MFGNCGSVSTSADLEVRWAAPTLGALAVELSASAINVRCTASASTRATTIPAAVLSRLGTGTGVITVGGRARSTVRAGAWAVEFTVTDSTYGTLTLNP